MAYSFQYPASTSVEANEQPRWLRFYSAPYSLKNKERTRSWIKANPFAVLTLPMPKEPGYQVRHEYGEGTNPVGPVLSLAALQNSGGVGNFDTLFNRILDPAKFQNEYMYATTTYRRFSNVTEATLVSEARKEYYFEYLFVPKNENDSIQVEEIIGTFRKASYPTVAGNLPERTYPQNIWALDVVPGDTWSAGAGGAANLTANWLGEPLPCVLTTVLVKRNDAADPIIRYLPNGLSNITLLALNFREFETGSYDPNLNQVLSKSEISQRAFPN
jgi:hypothetical protein